ncbi:Uncharacterised protein [uncultured archaeon]|nr:Uncharacterised protein [uncultured archaeon]
MSLLELKDPKLEELQTQVQTLEQELKTANENFENDKIVKSLKRKIANLYVKVQNLCDKEDKIRLRVAEKYVTDGGRGASYHTTSLGYRHEGNLAPYVVQAIKDIVGPISKLTKTQVEDIVNKLIDEDQTRATADVRAEINKANAEQTQKQNELNRLENELLMPHRSKLAEAKGILANYSTTHAPTPRQRLKTFREQSTAPETITKIRERIDQLINEERREQRAQDSK